MFRTLKVFDCQEMPPDVKAAYFEHYEAALIQSYNGSYLEWGIADEVFENENDAWALRKKMVDAWLIANGAIGPATEDDDGEEVLIRFWW